MRIAKLAIVGLVAILLAGNAHAVGSQKWYPITATTANNSPPVGPPISITVNHDAVTVLAPAAEQSADLSGTWGYSIVITSIAGPGAVRLLLDIGKWDGASFTSAGQVNLLAAAGTATGTITVGDFVFAPGETLAFGFRTNGENKLVTMSWNDANTWFESPSTDPGYPTPELSTLILVGVGLVAVGSVVYFRRK